METISIVLYRLTEERIQLIRNIFIDRDFYGAKLSASERELIRSTVMNKPMGYTDEQRTIFQRVRTKWVLYKKSKKKK